ncbi:hypothetical protein FS749_009233 [Ceratobasidium sp. UAMH 11750]|nr:hypothetical protein FS749_009233 [Ceratobasidium sp. UAMH 11750]
MEEDASGDIGLSTSHQPKALGSTLRTTNTRRAPPPAIELPSPNAAMWKAPSPGSPNVMSPTSSTPPVIMNPPPSARLVRSRTMPRLSSRLEPQIHDLANEEPESLEQERIPALQRWILSVAVIDFDLDIGPVVAKLYPNIKLDAPDRENIAFSSFPDTTLFDTGTQTHSFKIRLSQPLSSLSSDSISNVSVLHGYACFMQRRDPTSKRGYLQRSVVLLTHLPYIGLFDRAIRLFGPMFFTHGNAMLQSGSLNICNWPDPTPGCTLELGLLGSVITTEIPRSDEEQQHLYSYQPDGTAIASLPTQPIIPLLADILPKLWSLWECLVLCDPVLVFAPSPAVSSAVVWWLRDLLRPTSSAGRSKHTTALASQAFGPAIGYHTKHNRYISKDSALLKRLEAEAKGGNNGGSRINELLRQHFAQRSQQVLAPLNRYFSSLLPKPPDAAPSPVPSIHFSSPSPSLNVPSPGSSRTPSPALRSKPISPATSSIGVPAPDLRVKPFNAKDFFASLKKHGAQLPFRSPAKQKEFYERWLKSPAFGAWISGRVDAAQHVLVRDN